LRQPSGELISKARARRVRRRWGGVDDDERQPCDLLWASACTLRAGVRIGSMIVREREWGVVRLLDCVLGFGGSRRGDSWRGKEGRGGSGSALSLPLLLCAVHLPPSSEPSPSHPLTRPPPSLGRCTPARATEVCDHRLTRAPPTFPRARRRLTIKGQRLPFFLLSPPLCARSSQGRERDKAPPRSHHPTPTPISSPR
jgi:hypothetical protein